MFSPDLVVKGVTFANAAAAGSCFLWSRCPFAMIYDSGRYFEIRFSASPGHVEKGPSFIAWIRVRLVGQHRILWQKIAKSCWDVGRYDLGCHGAIGLLWLHKCGSRIFACLLFWYG